MGVNSRYESAFVAFAEIIRFGTGLAEIHRIPLAVFRRKQFGNQAADDGHGISFSRIYRFIIRTSRVSYFFLTSFPEKSH